MTAVTNLLKPCWDELYKLCHCIDCTYHKRWFASLDVARGDICCIIKRVDQEDMYCVVIVSQGKFYQAMHSEMQSVFGTAFEIMEHLCERNGIELEEDPLARLVCGHHHESRGGAITQTECLTILAGEQVPAHIIVHRHSFSLLDVPKWFASHILSI